MRFGLFAAGGVGLQIAGFLGDSGNIPACLVLDSDNTDENNNLIADTSKVDPRDIFYSNTLYSDRTLQSLKEYDLDLIFLVWWPYIIKKEIIEIPRIGCINTHYSCLPYNRGKNGNFWTFIEGTPFGATLHFVNEGVDAGDIAFQIVIEKTWEDTGGTLYEKVKVAIVDLFINNFERMKTGCIPRRDQNLLCDIIQGSYHNSKELEPASRIHLDRSYTAEELLNLIRARTFPPHPAAWFFDNGQKYEVRVTITRAGN
jgi:methionyl-tRNA formyltransferase